MDAEQAKDRFGERTTDADLLGWCAENDVVLVTNDTKDFEHQYGTDGIENELVDLGEWYNSFHE